MRTLMHFILIYITPLILLTVFLIRYYAQGSPRKQNSPAKDTFERSAARQQSVLPTDEWKAIDQDIQSGNYGLLHSLVVIRDNNIVFEKYYNKWKANEIHDLQSATKSVLSILIGIAIDKGYIKSVEASLESLLPGYPFQPGDSVKKQIRLKHLLTMTAGFEWTEQSVRYKQPGNSLTDMYVQDKNWLDFIMERPIMDKPGTKFNYNSGISILLGAILQHNVKISIQHFAEQFLFQPLGITHYQWSEYAGIAHGGGGLYLTARDMAKLGQLYLNEGRWNNRQVVSKKWVRESTKPRFRASADASYGYHWWTTGRLFNLTPITYAAGDGWQFIYVVKQLNLVIVTTGRNYSFESSRTTLTQNELLASILCMDTSFRKWMTAIFKKQEGNEKLSFYEVFLLTFSLNHTGDYEKTIRFFTNAPASYQKDFRFNFLLGKAYFYTGQTEKAREYLERCVSYCEQHSLPEMGYRRLAEELIGLL